MLEDHDLCSAQSSLTPALPCRCLQAFPVMLLQACTFKPEQLSAQKAARGRALLMTGAAASVTPARSSRFSAVAAMDDLDKYEVSLLLHKPTHGWQCEARSKIGHSFASNATFTKMRHACAVQLTFPCRGECAAGECEARPAPSAFHCQKLPQQDKLPSWWHKSVIIAAAHCHLASLLNRLYRPCKAGASMRVPDVPALVAEYHGSHQLRREGLAYGGM